MGKYRFYIIVLVLAVLVQHVQVYREAQQGRENWRQFRLQMDAQRANAGAVLAFPLTTPVYAGGAALATAASTVGMTAAMGPLIIGGLVVAGVVGAYWAWTHGGKEAYIIAKDAMRNGESLTPDKIKTKIAEMRGIDTSGLPDGTLQDGKIYHSGLAFSVVSQGISTPTGVQSFNPAFCATGYGNSFASSPGPVVKAIYYRRSDLPKDWFGFKYEKFAVTAVAAAPGFNPTEFWDSMTEPAKYQSILDFFHGEKDNLEFPAELSWVPPTDPNFPHPPPVRMVGVAPDGTIVDNTGKKYTVPDGFVDALRQNMGLPDLDPNSSAQVSVDVNGQAMAVQAPKTLTDQLRNAGIPETAKILGVEKNAVTWQGEYGPPVTTYVSDAVAALASGVVASAQAGGSSGGGGGGGSDKPDDTGFIPSDPTMVPPLFDPEFDFGEKKDFDISGAKSVVESLPMVNLIRGSAVTTSGSNSVITIHLSSWPGGAKTLQFDFDQYDFLFHSMGSMIYFIAMMHSLSFALLGRGA